MNLVSEKEKYLEKLKAKIHTGAKLTHWDNKVIALQKSLEQGYSTAEFVDKKISEIVTERKRIIDKKKLQQKSR